jgi:CheY-like chemotaxis protein
VALKIALAEDNEDHVVMYRTALEQAGHTVVVAGDGEAALDLLASERADLLLLDVEMPGLTGFEVLQRMKAAEPPIAVPVAVLSAHRAPGGPDGLRTLGLEGWLEKGTYSPVVLAGWVERWALRRQAGARVSSEGW